MGETTLSNNLSAQLLAEMYGQVSSDPFVMLVTLTHTSFTTLRLVNNTENVVSRGNTYNAFPMTITPPVDDGESLREVSITFDNVSLESVDELRTVTTPIDVVIEMVLASSLDTVQHSLEELKIRNITYNKSTISARLYMDDFLSVELTSEKYDPGTFNGLF